MFKMTNNVKKNTTKHVFIFNHVVKKSFKKLVNYINISMFSNIKYVNKESWKGCDNENESRINSKGQF